MNEILGLDCGSTRIKLGTLNGQGKLRVVAKTAAPELMERGMERTADPYAYLHAADRLLTKVRSRKEQRLGLTTQRSSFLIWERHSGRPVTPLISWQDLRGDAWCRGHREIQNEVQQATGLVLSPHYAATKLAVLLEADPSLRDRAERGLLRFGTLDTWLLWHWTDGGVFETDVSIAARTLLVDLETRDWSPKLRTLFGVPGKILPRVRRSSGFHIHTNRKIVVAATVADQAAGALPLFCAKPKCAYVNAGTGTFVMRAARGLAPNGYQTALLDGTEPGPATLWEGAINAGAHLMRGLDLPSDLRELRAAVPEDAFAVPDRAGLGAPYWRADLSLYLSSAARALDEDAQAWVVFQAYFFRIRQVIDGLFPDGPPEEVVLSGGLSARKGFSALLAAFLRLPLLVLVERDLGLWGAAWLAEGRTLAPRFQFRAAAKLTDDAALEGTYRRWLEWMAAVPPVTDHPGNRG